MFGNALKLAVHVRHADQHACPQNASKQYLHSEAEAQSCAGRHLHDAGFLSCLGRLLGGHVTTGGVSRLTPLRLGRVLPLVVCLKNDFTLPDLL